MARKKTTVKKSKKYVATVINPNFNGKVAGVRFWDGKALVTEETIDKFLGRSLEEVIRMMEKDFGYEITELVEE
jgi:hypothetical protein